jgi:diaminopimelate epimerase
MNAATPPGRPFLKMHGLGNDFVILDGRTRPLAFDVETIRRIADRRTGVGFDQLIVIEPSRSPDADIFMSIYNADGSEVSACGNASRCVAWLLAQETGRRHVALETNVGVLTADTLDSGQVTVDMGPALLDWQDIPLAAPADTLHLPLALGSLTDPVGVNMGNPHAVFFVADAESVDLAEVGPPLETNPLFPARCNIEVAQILGDGRIRMRVWERGAGITPACGTGACATLVAAVRRGLSGRQAEVLLDGGSLFIDWQDDGRVLMTGPVALAYTGLLDRSLLS